ncbi:odorant receptor 85c-like [Schistocerca serialis cubense]|uniref:odorant receptor 85c-like n=1 Tax=Schistocerca serialis cubense TaxID=2023355 RepID=UPI00214EEACD|nr:odorant receptor 85c-like [Schistocerca serialis cubense]
MLYLELRQHARHHQSVLRCVSLLQSAMSVSIFILLSINMANLCFIMFVTVELLQREGNMSKPLKTIFVMPALLYQTWMYCIFGQIITDQNEKLVDSAFGCGWTDTDSRFKRSLAIVMMTATRPLKIRIGKTCDLSRALLLQVLNGTYGLLNMLCNFNTPV